METATIDWDAIELLPRFVCSVCTTSAVPWGRTLDDRYFCSKRCCEEHERADRRGAVRIRSATFRRAALPTRRSHRGGSPAARGAKFDQATVATRSPGLPGEGKYSH